MASAVVVSIGLYVMIALLEITGCFAIWAWLRLDRSAWWIVPGVLCLLAFAVLLTRVDAALAGRAFAAYGGVYIGTALAWSLAVERTLPDRWDVIGAAICVLGAMVILLGPRP